MNENEFFFSAAVDLKDHSWSRQNKDAMYAVHAACRSVNQPNRYGSALETIMITAVLQDYASKFHHPYISYDPDQKVLQAKIKVDLAQLLASDFVQTVNIYENVILQVLDEIKEQLSDFDLDKLKADLHEAIEEEIKVST